MICPNCGKENPADVGFCGSCGAKLDRQTQPQTTPRPERVYIQQPVTEETLPEKYRPLSPWAYFGYSILFALPIIGFIMLIVFSCKKSNINRRNFARSYWCKLILCIIIIAVAVLVAALTVGLDRISDWIRMYR
jgi:hypothetical protein